MTFDKALNECELFSRHATLLVRKQIGQHCACSFAWYRREKILFRAAWWPASGIYDPSCAETGTVPIDDLSMAMYSAIEQLATEGRAAEPLLRTLEELHRLEQVLDSKSPDAEDNLPEWLENSGEEIRPLRLYVGMTDGVPNPTRDRFDIERLRPHWLET